MSGNNEHGVDPSGQMQNHQTVVSLENWRAKQVPSSSCASASDAMATLTPAAPSMGFDPALMPKPSVNQKRFMEIMSGDEDDPTFAVSVVMFFWRFSRRGMPMPKRALALLDRHAAAGDPTCILVRDWLSKKMVRSGRRPLWVFEGSKA